MSTMHRRVRSAALVLGLLGLGSLSTACGSGAVDGGSNQSDRADAGGCETNTQCIDANGGTETFVCDRTAHVCKNLLSVDCPSVLADVGAIRNDDVAIFAFPALPSLSPELRDARDAVELARRDFRDKLGGLPRAQGAARPIAVVLCDASAGSSVNGDAINAHLFGDLGIQSSIGFPIASMAGLQAEAAKSAGGVVLGLTPADPATTGPFIGDQGSYLVHALDPRDEMTALGQVALFQLNRLDSIVPGAPPAASAKVVLVVPGDGGAATNTDAFQALLSSVAPTNYLEVALGSSAQVASGSDVAKAVSTLVAFSPDLIACAGPSCGALASAAEQARPAKMAYVLTNLGASGPDVAAFPAAADRARVLGVRGGRPEADPRHQAFALRFSATFPDDSAGVFQAVTWDVAHAMFLSAIAADSFRGADIGSALRTRFTAGASAIQSDDIQAAANALLAGQSIDYPGAAFDLHYDASGKIVDFPVAVDCLASSGAGDSGMTYDVTSGKLAGTLVACP